MRQFDFVKNRKYAFGFSILLFVLFAVFYVITGPTLDISFKGGTRMSFETVGEIDSNKAGELIEQAINKKVVATVTKTYSAEANQDMVNMVRIDIAGNEPITSQEEETVKTVLKDNFNVKLDSNKNEIASISPSIGRETLEKGLLAVFISSVLILFYIAWRFSIMSGFTAAFTAVVALLHDAGMMFGVYIIFKIPLNDIFIATILTIIGYSINDTIVVYDRIRENAVLMKKSELGSIVNVSIHQTLSRSINTMMTTLICVVVLLVFSSLNNIASLQDFSFALTLGIISGCYSTVFIASPLWLAIRERHDKKKLQQA